MCLYSSKKKRKIKYFFVLLKRRKRRDKQKTNDDWLPCVYVHGKEMSKIIVKMCAARCLAVDCSGVAPDDETGRPIHPSIHPSGSEKKE
jgi:hypothetical protein